MKGKNQADFSEENQGRATLCPEEHLPTSHKISLIAPIYNEALGLPAWLAHLSRYSFYEVIVVDGKSTDRSTEILSKWVQDPKARARRRVISSTRGRGKQMNTGAFEARGEILLFLHGDTYLPADALKAIQAAVEMPNIVGGAFRLNIASPHPFLKMISRLSNLRARLLKLPYGDQGYFVRKTAFEEMGGYADLPLMEDVEFFGRLRRQGRIALLKAAVITSARRWQGQGYCLTSLRNLTILCLYFLGISPKKLAHWYHASSTSP